MRFLLVFGIAFEFPVFLYSAAAIGVVGWRQLASARRWAVLIIVTVGAVVTPSGDPITLLLLSIPLYVFYEATIWIVRFTLRR
jgi:sec-independent protein translocase protein TatC